LSNEFYNDLGEKFEDSNDKIIQKFEKITGIKERRYVTDEYVTSDIAYFAAKDALESAKIDKESLDYIIVAHNFGDVRADNKRSDFVPSLSARVKNKLGIENPATIAYDLPFGCPGWTQGIIMADYYIRSGDAKRVLVIGAETLSRISDPHDRDSMIYSDGAGATILESIESEEPVGILSHASRSDTKVHSKLMWMHNSNKSDFKGNELFLKMNGRRLYEYAISYVPQVVKDSLNKAGITLNNIKKVLIHQANEKLDIEVLNRLYKLYGKAKASLEVMPMTISYLGNSSVATVPTLIDLLLKKKLNGHALNSGEYAVFASVGAGMNISTIVYKML
ncbi:3-oxoacyl-ACP synthase III family protein, partial [Bacteroidota bacterium]